MTEKENLLKNLNPELADAMVEMMYERMGPELTAMISNAPFNPNHLFRYMYISQLCKKSREEKNLSIKEISKELKLPQYKVKYIEENSLNNIDTEILEKYIDHLGLRSEFDEWLVKNRDVYEELGKRK